MDILYTVLVVDKECHGPAETLCRLHCSNALHDLADKVDEGGVISLPLDLNIVTNARYHELKLGAFSKIRKLSQVLFKDAFPDLGENFSFL